MSSVERAVGEFLKCGPSSLSKWLWSPDLTLAQDQALRRPLGAVPLGKGGADSPLSLQGCASRLLAPSSQLASPGDASASAKMLPRSQDLEAPRRRREGKELRILFFFLNILERKESSTVGNEGGHPQVQDRGFSGSAPRNRAPLSRSGPRSSLTVLVPLIRSTEVPYVSGGARCWDQSEGCQDRRQNLGP